MKPVFAGALVIFPTMLVLAALPGKNSRFALRQFSRRAFRGGGTVPGKISNAPLCEAAFSCYFKKKAEKVRRYGCFH